MIICPKCGTELSDGAVFCSKCGSSVAHHTPPTGSPAGSPQGSTSDKVKSGVNDAVNKTKDFFFNTNDESSMQDASDVQENKVLALVSYLGYFFFIPMIVKPYSRYLRFHGNQGLTLCLYLIAVNIVTAIITGLIGLAAFAGVGAAIAVAVVNWIIYIIFYGSFVALAAIGIYNAVKGYAKELPLIGRIRLLREY